MFSSSKENKKKFFLKLKLNNISGDLNNSGIKLETVNERTFKLQRQLFRLFQA